MNLKDMAEALALGMSALDIMKKVKDMLPDGPKKEEATAKLIEAESKLKESQVRTAKELGYQLCRCEYLLTLCLKYPREHLNVLTVIKFLALSGLARNKYFFPIPPSVGKPLFQP